MTSKPGRASLAALAVAQTLGTAAAGISLTASALTVTNMLGSPTFAGLAQSATIVGAGALAFPVSRFATRRDRSASLRFAYTVASAGSALAALGAAVGALAVFLLGMAGAGSGTVAGLALRFAAADLAPDPAKRPRYIALILWTASIGSLIGPPLTAFSTRSGLSSGPFLLIASLYGLSVLVVSLARLPPPGSPTVAAQRQTPVCSVGQRRPLAARVAITVSTSGHMAMTALMGLAPIFLDDAGVSAEGIGAIMSAHLVGMYVASPVFSAVVRAIGPRAASAIALASTLSSCAVLGIGLSSPVGFGIGLTVLGLGWSLGMIASSAALASGPADGRLRTQGFADTLLTVGAGAASVLGGLMAGLAGYPALVALVAVGVTIALAALGLDIARVGAAGSPETARPGTNTPPAPRER
ncbi:MFS transporter [Leifsonia xyli]|uniref:MFS transporter n=1 Tax=Leifsonia xyli TaxID=1575 RepID=UPI00146FA7B5|nr:MFS transporter [Leifsonia xyli]